MRGPTEPKIEIPANRKIFPREKCLHELFQEQAAQTPDNVAVVAENRRLTYAELNSKSNQLAHYLRHIGVGPNVRVGLCVNRSLEFVVAVLGILKAGGAYVPMDPSFPSERLDFLLKDAEIPLLVTQDGVTKPFNRQGLHVVNLDLDWDKISGEDSSNLSPTASPDDTVYVIYTSGSTGTPKGVLVSHYNVVRLFQSTHALFEFDSTDVWTLFHSCAFDFSVWEMWGALLYGGRLVVVPYWVSRSPEAFCQLLQSENVTVLNQTPSAFRQLIKAEEQLEFAEDLALRVVVFGGEALDLQSLIPWIERHGDKSPQLVNMYGITETTVHVTYRRITADDVHNRRESVIGAPIADLELHILDEKLQPVPEGIPGEMYVAGAGLSAGYLDRPTLTAERFIGNPFDVNPESRLYKTGDLARRLPDGDIEYLGRIDDQVQIHGFRIEPREIEAMLGGHPDIRETAVVPLSDSEGTLGLAAYFVASAEDVTIGKLRQYLSARLPSHMIPTWLVLVESLPLTVNGKLDRQALPAPNQSREGLGELVAATTPTEQLLAQAWCKVLDIEQVGIRDNFFDLGGDSIKATRLVTHVRKTWNVELPIQTVFESPRIVDLSAKVDANVRAGVGLQNQPMATVPRDRPLPLSFGQERMWFQDQYEGASNSPYNLLLAYELSGDLDAMILERCLREVVRRHEVLRTTYHDGVEGPRQSVQRATFFALQRTRLHDVAVEDRVDETQRWAAADARQPFDLQQGPLLRARLLEFAPSEHVLILVVHHIAFDGWSEGVLYDELDALYRAYSDDQASPLVELPIQYADFAVRQREWLAGDRLQTQLAYWKRQLAGCPELLQLPADHARPAHQTYEGRLSTRRLPVSLSRSLKEFGDGEGSTLFMTLLAAFNVLLSRYIQSEDIVVGSALANRQWPEVEELIGFFVNSLPLRTDLRGNPTFRELLGRVREMTLAAYTHQDVPLEQLVAAVQPDRDTSHATLFQVMFALQNAVQGQLTLADLQVRRLPADPGTSKMDLIVTVYDEPEGLELWFEYNTDLFEPDTIERMIGHFQQLLTGIVANPDERIGQLPLLSEQERQQVVVQWNQTATDYPRDASIQQLFEAQAESSPEKIALIDESGQMTYRQLNRRANQLAHYLADLGVERGTPVGVCLDRSLEMIVSILAILKSGGAYVPLESGYPLERLAFMLKDTQAPVLITTQPLAEKFADYQGRRVLLDQERERIQSFSCENPDLRSSASDVAYVMYTSGSSGRPKGTNILHRGVVRLVSNTNYVSLGAEEVFLQFAPLSFDASTFEIWAPLLNGGRLVMFPPGLPSLEELGQFVAGNEVSTLWLTAGLFHQLGEAHLGKLAGLRQLLVGGDVVSPRQARLALSQLPGCRLINGYGPTENTTFTACYPMESVEDVGETVSIGWPIANTQVYVMDRYDQPVPIGVAGQLYIGGDGLARDYLNQPELTQEKFIRNPLDNDSDSRLYKTGDRVRWRGDGKLEFLGRIDQQVKIRGFRIELEEIEAVLGEHPSVRAAVVQPRELAGGEKQLVGYVVARPDQTLQVSALRQFLKFSLPEYMIPSLFVELDALPLTANGKVDRQALPDPGSDRPELDVGFVPPNTPQQKTLADIWMEVLGIDRVGVHDNFFELGGHSLMATQVVSRIQIAFGKKIPLVDLMDANTIAKQTLLLQQPSARSETVSLVGLRVEGSKPPLILMPDVGGEASRFQFLMEQLPNIHPVFALQVNYASDTQRCKTLEDLARKCVAAFQDSSVGQPVHLVGYSFGGMLAYEVARQLQLAGVGVASVLIIDTGPAFNGTMSFPTRVRGCLNCIQNAPRWLAFKVREYNARQLWTLIERKGRKSGRRLRRLWNGEPNNRLEPNDIWDMASKSQEERETWRAHLDAFLEYQPGSYSGRIKLFRCHVRPSLHSLEHDLGWSRVDVGGVDVIHLPGGHESIFREPYSRVLAARMCEVIDQNT